MKKIFIDSSILLPFIDRSDINHQKAVQTLENLAGLNYQLYTSIQNINEVYNTLAREVGVSTALDFLQVAILSNMEILFPQKADLITAYRMLSRNRDRQLTLREVLNSTLMQKKGVMQIITFTYWHNLFGTYVSNLSPS